MAATAIDQCCRCIGAQVRHRGACGRVGKDFATSERSWGSKEEAYFQPDPGPCARVTTGEQLVQVYEVGACGVTSLLVRCRGRADTLALN